MNHLIGREILKTLGKFKTQEMKNVVKPEYSDIQFYTLPQLPYKNQEENKNWNPVNLLSIEYGKE